MAGVTVLDAPYLILFKIKAWLDLTARRAAGEQIDSKNIRKHKNDVFRLTELLDYEQETSLRVPVTIFANSDKTERLFRANGALSPI